MRKTEGRKDGWIMNDYDINEKPNQGVLSSQNKKLTAPRPPSLKTHLCFSLFSGVSFFVCNQLAEVVTVFFRCAVFLLIVSIDVCNPHTFPFVVVLVVLVSFFLSPFLFFFSLRGIQTMILHSHFMHLTFNSSLQFTTSFLFMFHSSSSYSYYFTVNLMQWGLLYIAFSVS